MRIAFLTPEFVTDYVDGGGLGSYISRMAKLLYERGHEPEIFLPSNKEPRIVHYAGFRVERVALPKLNLFIRVARRFGNYHRHPLLQQALALASALEDRHAVAPFDIVQSADYMGVGFSVRPVPGRVHVIRCSTAADLYNEFDGLRSDEDTFREELERSAMRRADRVYSPSAYVAEHFNRRHQIPVGVVRPPAALEVAPSMVEPFHLGRFLMFFGQFLERKGVKWLIQALKLAFKAEPGLRMVWVGQDSSGYIRTLLTELGEDRAKVLILYPLQKRELYALVKKADAVVLPSLVDNLPNTVIESLLLGIPVIGTRGASINELVRSGLDGELVEPNNVLSLATAIINAWQGRLAARKGFIWGGELARELQPDNAIENFLEFVKGSR